MQPHATHRQPEYDPQIMHAQALRLEDLLHERDIHQRELGEERDRHRRDEHPVLEYRAPEPAVLDRGHQIEEDEAGEGLDMR
ncbi:hypothetical protein CVT26_011819 [Gymnopilus dilepis]|uniref:Uncharacterized protein n=1 Tax=Gymnopilus dilepis TaxID=231916 RepID=A0A409X6V4_9AGAR|nr:hypothetical protein CVT26_011819 [Gymnopilus dilepis]